MLKLYGFSRVNSVARGHTRDLRILWALEEMQLPFELVGLDHPKHELSTDAYRKLSPFEQIPAIDDDGVVVSESGAILIYLAKKSGKLIPKDPAGEAQVIRWCFAALNTVELPLLNLLILGWLGNQDAQHGVHDFMVQWANRHLGNLERWLEGREYVATDNFTVADILMAHVLEEANEKDTSLNSYVRVREYRDRCYARPARKRTLDKYYERVKAA